MFKKNDNSFIQNHMYEGKHSKSVYKGFKACMFILVCLLFMGWVNYKKLLLFEEGFSSNSALYWAYKNFGFTILKIVFVVFCLGVIFLGIWDIKRLKKLKNS